MSLAAPATGLAVTSPGWTAAQQLSGEGVIGGQGGVASTDSGRTAAIWLEQNGDGDRRLNARVREANGVWGATEAISGWSSNLSNEPLLQANGDGSFTLLWFGTAEALPADVADAARAWRARGVVLALTCIDPRQVDVWQRYGVRSGGAAYLLRPDQHVCARWFAVTPHRLDRAMRAALALA